MSVTTSPVYGLLAEFDTPAALVAAARRTHAEGYRKLDTFSPFPIEEAWEAIGHHDRRMSFIVLMGGIIGGVGGRRVRKRVPPEGGSSQSGGGAPPHPRGGGTPPARNI